MMFPIGTGHIVSLTRYLEGLILKLQCLELNPCALPVGASQDGIFHLPVGKTLFKGKQDHTAFLQDELSGETEQN